MDSRIEISFNIKATVPVKDIKAELIRQQSLLEEYTANPVGKDEELPKLKVILHNLKQKRNTRQTEKLQARQMLFSVGRFGRY